MVWINSAVTECSAVKELKATVEGVGIASSNETKRGIRSSIVSRSGVGARGDSKGNVKL